MKNNIDLLLVGAFESTDSNTLRFLAPQLGIERLASYLRNKGYAVKTIDPNIDELETYHRYVKREPLVIGFSISYITLLNDLEMIDYAKKKSSHSLLVAGGQQATFDYDRILKVSPLDLIVLGEGEKTLLKIIERKKNNQSLYNIRGTVHKRNGIVTRVGNSEPLTQDEFIRINLELDFSDIDYRKYWKSIEKFYDDPNYNEIRTIRLFTINYCPFKCTYCSSRSFLNFAKGSVDYLCNPKGKVAKVVGLTSRDLIHVIMNAISAYPETRRFLLQDDEHFLIKGRIEEFCNLILRNKKDGNIPRHLEFMCQSRVNDINPHLLKLMRRAGYTLIGYGVESFSDRILKSVHKKNTAHDIHNAIKWTIDAEIKPFINIIVFLPETQIDDLLETIDSSIYYIKKGVEVATEPLTMPLPGSSLYYSDEYKKHKEEIKIKGTNQIIERVHFTIPKDEYMEKITYQFFHNEQKYINYIREKYSIRHLPTRLKSLVTFYSICDLIEDKTRKDSIEAIIKSLTERTENHEKKIDN